MKNMSLQAYQDVIIHLPIFFKMYVAQKKRAFHHISSEEFEKQNIKKNGII